MSDMNLHVDTSGERLIRILVDKALLLKDHEEFKGNTVL